MSLPPRLYLFRSCGRLTLPPSTPPFFLSRWIESEGPKRLKKLDENVTKKENEVTDAKLAIQELEEVIRGIESEIHLADKNRKNMDDNIRHRQFKTKVEVARAEIQSLDIASARIARDSYEKKYAKSKKNEQELTQQVRSFRRGLSLFPLVRPLFSELTRFFLRCFSTLRSWERSRHSRFNLRSSRIRSRPSTRTSRPTS